MYSAGTPSTRARRYSAFLSPHLCTRANTARSTEARCRASCIYTPPVQSYSPAASPTNLPQFGRPLGHKPRPHHQPQRSKPSATGRLPFSKRPWRRQLKWEVCMHYYTSAYACGSLNTSRTSHLLPFLTLRPYVSTCCTRCWTLATACLPALRRRHGEAARDQHS